MLVVFCGVFFAMSSSIFATPALASDDKPCAYKDTGFCYEWAGTPPSLGCYIECVLPTVWTMVTYIFAAIAIILVIVLIYKTVTAYGSGNAQSLQELPMKWAYVLILALLAIGVGGTILNILLPWLGFPGVDDWIEVFQAFLDNWLKPEPIF